MLSSTVSTPLLKSVSTRSEDEPKSLDTKVEPSLVMSPETFRSSSTVSVAPALLVRSWEIVRSLQTYDVPGLLKSPAIIALSSRLMTPGPALLRSPNRVSCPSATFRVPVLLSVPLLVKKPALIRPALFKVPSRSSVPATVIVPVAVLVTSPPPRMLRSEKDGLPPATVNDPLLVNVPGISTKPK